MSLIYSPSDDSYLMQKAIKRMKNKNIRLLEMGCGSGINLETAKKIGIEEIFGSDVNKEAVKYCEKLGFNCKHSNLFSAIKGKFDLIIFNPPYLPENKMEDGESSLATTGGKEGSELINEFLKQAKNHLKKEGKIFLLTSSLTKNIDWLNFKKRKILSKKIFFEELYVWELTLGIGAV